MKFFATTLTLTILVLSLSFSAKSQDMHFSQFNGAPMIMNPALAGYFDGQVRVTGIYRNQWSSVTTPYVTFGGSVDAPLKGGDEGFLGGGLSIYNDRSGDGNLANLTALGTLAYHKLLGDELHSFKSLSVGLQGGYTQKSIDLSRLYWQDEFNNGGFQPGTTGEQLNPKISYFTANAGINWGHRTGERFAYQIGVGGHNLNQPRESFEKKKNNEVGLGMRINGQIGAIWDAGERLSIRPAVMYQTQSSASEMIAGSEFLYIVGDPFVRSVATSIFLGGWYRTGDAAIFNAGFETNGFRVGFAYDYNFSDLKVASGGNGGFEITLRYVKPNPLDFAKRIVFPCSRF